MSSTIGGQGSKNLQTDPFERQFSLDGWSLALGLTLAAAFLIRLWALGSVPAALHPDEVAGYAGVLDELTGRAPVRAFFDYRIMYLPLYGVSQLLSSLFLGNSATGLRFPAVLFGVATVYCTIGLTRRLTGERTTALAAGAIAAILPWDVTVSRVGWEPAAMLPFVLGGLWALDAGLETRSARRCALAGLLFGIGAYSYRAALPDSAVLAAALLACRLPRVRAAWHGVALMAAVWIAALVPFAVSVARDPDFFWRDRRISTFAGGVNAHSFHLLTRNYAWHFNAQALFRTGDGNANHGPAFGVLYVWMLPWIVFGALAAWRRYGAGIGAFAWIWLLLYPLGGSLTNDGVPHFLRTVVGAPLACMLAAIGLIAAWDFAQRTPLAHYRAQLAAVFAAIVLAQFVLFCRAYFIVYPQASADANQYEYREIFTTVRALAPAESRACFVDLNPMNSLTLFAFYLRSTKLELLEGLQAECSQPNSILVAKHVIDTPPDARLVATAQNYEGRTVDYIYVTK